MNPDDPIKSDASLPSEPQVRSSELVRCWCRACRQDKNENEMFAGIIHPDGIGRGICIQCHQTGKDVERWKRLDEQTAPNAALNGVKGNCE